MAKISVIILAECRSSSKVSKVLPVLVTNKMNHYKELMILSSFYACPNRVKDIGFHLFSFVSLILLKTSINRADRLGRFLLTPF